MILTTIAMTESASATAGRVRCQKPIEEAAPRAEGREPAEHHAEDIEQEDAGHEGGRGDAEHAEHDDDAVKPRAAPEGGEHAEQDAGHQHDHAC